MKLRRTNSGYTLVEMLCSVAIGSAILAALVSGSVALQRIFYASDDYYQATEDQSRVIDYLVRDLRRSGSGSVSNNGTTLQVNYPDYVDYSLGPNGTARTPSISVGLPKFGVPTATVAYNTNPLSVTYTTSSSGGLTSITRQQAGTTATVTTDRTAGYVLTDANPSGGSANFSFGSLTQTTSVKTTITFTPRLHNTNTAAAQTGSAVFATTFFRKGTYDTIK